MHLLGNRLEQQQYEAVLRELKQSPYPAFTSYMVLKLQCFDAKYFKDARDAKDEKERNELLLKTWEQMIKMISAKDDTDHRFYWHVIEDLFAKPNLFFFDKKDKTPLFLDALAGEEELDPWLRFMLLGNCYGKMSYSLSDSEQTQCLAQMRNCFEQAHELHPEYPEAAVELIENMRQKEIGIEKSRYWFDEAVKAQSDWDAAYKTFLRIAHNHDLAVMVKFGLECAATERYDTNVPSMFIDAVKSNYSVRAGSDILSTNEMVYPNLKKVCEAYLDRVPKNSRKYKEYKSWLLVGAAKTKNLDDLKLFLKKYDGQSDNLPFQLLDLNQHEIVSHTAALASPAGPLIREVKKSLENGSVDLKKFGQQLNQLELARMDMPGEGSGYADSLINIGNSVVDFEKGDWAELTFDPELSFWNVNGGAWEPEESQKAIVLNTGKGIGEAKIEWGYSISYPITVEVDVEALEPNDVHNYCDAGLAVGLTRRYFVNSRNAGFKRPYESARRFAHPKAESKKPTKHKLQIHVWESGYPSVSAANKAKAKGDPLKFELNSKQFLMMVDNRKVALRVDEGFSSNHVVGLASFQNKSKTTKLRFSNFRVRKMKLPPIESEQRHPTKYWDQWLQEYPNHSYGLHQRGVSRVLNEADFLGATQDLELAAQLDPTFAENHFWLGRLYEQSGEFEKAKASYLRAVALDPVHPEAKRLLAWLEATCSIDKLRDGKSAVARSKFLNRLAPGEAWPKALCAAGWAAQGDFEKAVNWQKKALNVEADSDEFKERLALYEAQKPYVHPPGPRVLVVAAQDAEEKETNANARQNATPVVIEGLVSRWPFEGSVQESEFGEKFNSQMRKGFPKFGDGRIGQSLVLTNDTYFETSFPDFSREDAFSFGAWFYVADDTQGELLGNVNQRKRGYFLGTTDDGRLQFQLKCDADHILRIITTRKYELERWQHVFATYDGSSEVGGLAIYIDGKKAEVSSNGDRLRGEISTEYTDFHIGYSSVGPMNLRVDEARIYDRPLSPEEVDAVASFERDTE